MIAAKTQFVSEARKVEKKQPIILTEEDKLAFAELVGEAIFQVHQFSTGYVVSTIHNDSIYFIEKEDYEVESL